MCIRDSFIRGETSYTDDGNYATEQKDARGKIVRTETDPERGTTTSVTDAKGQKVTYEYDNLRRIVKTSAKTGAEAGIPTVHNEYTYDEQRGNLVEIRHNTDGNAANDVVYSFEQDALGRQTAVKVGNQTLSQSAYQNDPTKPNFGTLTATTYGNGAKVSSRYDDFNRVTGVVYGEETAPRYEYDYNAKGQVARVRDNLLNRTTQSEYDLANRPVRVKTAEAGQHVYTGQVAYDNVYGNLSEFTEKVGENRQEYGTKFGYDDENRPTSLTYSANGKEIGQSTTTIDKLNRTTFSAVKLGSKTFTSEYHFAAGGYGTGSVTNLVSSITQPGCNCGYGYDDNGNIASATLNGKWTGYTYDALGQLIQVNDHSDTRSGENGTTWKYTYDLGGNILKKERFAYADTTNPLETVTYTYGDANWRDKLTAVNGSTIRYDAIGNPLSDGTWTYTWQNGRQLQKMQKAGMTAEFVYNADGLRVQKTVNGVVTKYTLHGKNVVHMTSGTDELHFFYDAQNRPAVVMYNGTAYAYVKSLQGDVIALLDGTGNVVVSYVYDAWGMPIGKSGTLAETLGTLNPFRYRGYVFDEETGLYYLRSRYYNPGWGRFVNADCIYSANCFAYCENAPIAFFDEDGMKMSLKIGFDDCDFVTRLMLGGAGGGFSYSGRCEDISSCASIDRAARAYEEQWTNSLYNTYSDTFKYTCGNNATPEMLKETATKAANKYIEENPGKGPVHGTKGHTYAENEIKQLQWENVKTEVSFKNTKQVDYGTPGSIRLDVVIVDGFGRPTYAIDFKFGNAPLTQTRINQILQNLPTKITIEKVP